MRLLRRRDLACSLTRAVAVLCTVAGGGALAAPAAATPGIQVTINGAPAAIPFISADEIAKNVDVEPKPGQLGPGGGPNPQNQQGLPGMSAKLLAELVGVAPSYTLSTMTITGTVASTGMGGSRTVGQSGVVSGFTDPPYESVPYYPVFVRSVISTGPNSGSVAIIYESPGFAPPGFYGGYYYPSGALAYDTVSSSADVLQADLVNTGIVLGVPQPAFNVCTPGVGQHVGFSLPPSQAVGLGQASGAPTDANGLTYSWDFGDGTPPTALSASDSTSHAYAATGAFDVRLTATDAAGNAGVSPQPAQVVVGSSPGVPGPCGQVPGGLSSSGAHRGMGAVAPSGGGAQNTGGGSGSPNTLSGGAAKGSVAAPTSTVAPRTAGPAAPAAAPLSSPGSSLAKGSGGRGPGGGVGGRASRGGGVGARGTGSRAAGGLGQNSGGAASSAGVAGRGAASTRPPSLRPVPAALAAPGLTGLLIDSAGPPTSGGLPAAPSSVLSLLQSVARASNGGGGSGGLRSHGLPEWLLGILAFLALLVLGVVRETRRPGLGGRGTWRAGAA